MFSKILTKEQLSYTIYTEGYNGGAECGTHEGLGKGPTQKIELFKEYSVQGKEYEKKATD